MNRFVISGAPVMQQVLHLPGIFISHILPSDIPYNKIQL